MPVQPEKRVDAKVLTDFCVRIFRKLGVPEADARITGDVLVTADLRGIESHGVARVRRYVDGIRKGLMLVNPATKVVNDAPSTALIDAGSGLGQPAAHRAMEMAIQKAGKTGAGFVTVRNSNHYGIAGYYAMMALEHDCIGMSMTNADVLVVPTFGRDAMLGTNPIAIAAPAGKERPFVLDMATSTVPRGKLEVYDRQGRPLPPGWATDENGTETSDAHRVLDNFKVRAGGGLLPLGGAGELLSGYKGYGLAAWVDVFSGVLSGAAFATLISPITADGRVLASNVGHFFGAWRVAGFRPIEEFKTSMDEFQRLLKNAPRVEGQDRIYIPGEKEYEKTAEYSKSGIPLNPRVADDLKTIAREVGTDYDL
jgi:L-2-hydroxycarboxylate dehydrogenase (NAD+)